MALSPVLLCECVHCGNNITAAEKSENCRDYFFLINLINSLKIRLRQVWGVTGAAASANYAMCRQVIKPA